MAKMPKPLPVTVVKFDEHGNPVATEVVQPLPDYKKRMMGLAVIAKSEWEPDEIRCDLRVIGHLKKGGTTVLAYAHKGNVAEKVDHFNNKRVDITYVSVEKLGPVPLTEEEKAAKELRERRTNATVQRTSRSGTAKMTDQDAWDVKFGRFANAKVSEAARALGLSYGQVYSAKNGYTFTHVTGD